MKPFDLGTYWMLGVIGVMLVYALIAILGVNKNSKHNSDKNSNQ